MLAEEEHRSPQEQAQFQQLCPQVRIYNRNFYIRRSEHEKLMEQREREIQELASKPKVNVQSYHILVQRLEKDLRELMREYEGEVDYAAFQQIVTRVGKFQASSEGLKRRLQEILTQLWLVMVDYDLERRVLLPNEVESLLTMLFCPHPLRQSEIVELLAYKFPHLDQHRQRYIQRYPQAGEECLLLEEVVEGWLRLRQKYYTPFAAAKKPPKEVASNSHLRFQPQINPRSKQMAGRSLQKYLSSNRIDNLGESKLNQLSGYISAGRELSYHQILYRRGLQKEQIMKTIRQQANPPSHEKTLSTSEVKRLVDNLYFTKERRGDVDHSRLKEQEELKLCTFKPEIIANYRPPSVANIKNYEKEVQRLEKGRRLKQKQKEAIQNLGRVKNKSTAPPSFIEREKPRLILEIKVGQRVQELRLKGDEEPRLVAKKFVRMHGLAAEMQEVLQSIIQEQLTAL